jgi:biopolymer transport protein ExbD
MDEKPFETINVIPFVDIMLVLLAMVLTTASLAFQRFVNVADILKRLNFNRVAIQTLTSR